MTVSFVIPSYNCAEYLGAAVESVREQTYKDLEIIVVNDASEDSTEQYLDWLTTVEPRAFVITNDNNLGRSASRNKGNALAKGEYIFVLDADDICTPRRVELTLPLLKKSAFVHGGAVKVGGLGNEIGPMITEKFSLEHTKSDPLKQSYIVHSTVAYTKSISGEYPYKTEQVAEFGIDDWDQQMRMAKGGVKFDFTPNYLAYYRDRSEGISRMRNLSGTMALKKELYPDLFEVMA